jgi:hypothetical protein
VVETDRPEAQIYQLRAVLRGISPLIWRRLLVRSDSTVARLHEVLQIAFGWDDEHLNRFETRGREYAVYRDGGCRFQYSLSSISTLMSRDGDRQLQIRHPGGDGSNFPLSMRFSAPRMATSIIDKTHARDNHS